MRVLIIGASGRTGRLVVDEALQRGKPLQFRQPGQGVV